jgi:hypothetical protein
MTKLAAGPACVNDLGQGNAREFADVENSHVQRGYQAYASLASVFLRDVRIQYVRKGCARPAIGCSSTLLHFELNSSEVQVHFVSLR